MGFTRDLLDGLAGELVAAGIGVYHDAGYTVDEVGIGLGDLPASCTRAIALTDYLNIGDHPTQALGSIRVQVLTRGLPDDKTSANDLRDAIFQALHGLTNRDYGSCHLIQLLRKSSHPLGLDASNRWRNADNYQADVNPPATPYRNQ